VSLLRAEGLGASFGDGPRLVTPVDSVSFEIEAGVIYSLSGRSGAGKTTLLSLLLGIDLPGSQSRQGTVWFEDQPVGDFDGFARLRRDSVVYVSQAAELVRFLRVIDNLRISAALGGAEITAAACDAALQRLGVADLGHRFPSELSGGERQRCALARCLVRAVPLLVIDEPTSSLDDDNADLVVDAIETVRSSGAAVLAASHDKRIEALADVNWVLERGKLSCA
jgi:ABC-type lipoprotein export system ATPase subunit